MKKVRKREKLVDKNKKCCFCETKTEPDYKDYGFLVRFFNVRGGILGRGKTGVCSKHQRLLSQAMKRARHLALLPFLTCPGG